MICFYHSADLDGHCSGAIVKHRYPECRMRGINYGQPFPFSEIMPLETVYLLDFSLQPFSEMIKLKELCDSNASKLVWIDHHATAIAEAEKHSFTTPGILKDGLGACALTWLWIYPLKKTPIVVTLLAEYDVWNHSNSNTLPLQYGFRTYEDTLPTNTALWNTAFESGDFLIDTVSTGKTILNYEYSQNSKFCKAYVFETTLPFQGKSLRAICANRGFTNSQLFSSIYSPENHDLMITFIRLKLPAEKWTVSLYSTHPDINCGEIAASFGGGGHKGAAGFQCETLPFKH